MWPTRVSAIPSRRRLVDEEVAGVRLGVGVPGHDLDAPCRGPCAARWRCASLFSTLTAITSTPRVIQASTTSFCFAGSVSVGPSQSSFTPSSRRRLLGALAAAHEVGVALVLGHHGHGEPVLRRARRRSAPAAGRGRRRRRAAATPLRLMRVSFPRRDGLAPMAPSEQDAREYTGELGGQVGQAQAVLQNGQGQRGRAACRGRCPRPRRSTCPPSTTAVIATSSKPVPASALAWPRRAT